MSAAHFNHYKYFILIWCSMQLMLRWWTSSKQELNTNKTKIFHREFSDSFSWLSIFYGVLLGLCSFIDPIKLLLWHFWHEEQILFKRMHSSRLFTVKICQTCIRENGSINYGELFLLSKYASVGNRQALCYTAWSVCVTYIQHSIIILFVKRDGLMLTAIKTIQQNYLNVQSSWEKWKFKQVSSLLSPCLQM